MLGEKIKAAYDNRVIKEINAFFVDHQVNHVIHEDYVLPSKIQFQKRLSIALISSAIGMPFIQVTFNNIAMTATVGIFLFLVLYYKHAYRLIKNIRNDCLEYERVIPLLRFLLKFLDKTLSKNEDVLIVFITVIASIRNISEKLGFSAFKGEMIKGMLPERILLQFKTPSKKVANFFKNCVDREGIKVLLNEKQHHAEYKIFLSTLESRVMIIVAQGIFFPIFTLILFIFNNVPDYLFAFLVIFHYVLLHKITKALLDKRFDLLFFENLLSQGKEPVLSTFLDFLCKFGIHLNSNTPEIAAFKAIKDITGEEIKKLNMDETIIFKGPSIQYILEKISDSSTKEMISCVCNLLLNLVDFMGDNLSDLVLHIVDELRRQSELEQEKQDIIKGERFKIKVILFCLPVILSVLTAMMPFILFHSPDTSASFLDLFFLNKKNENAVIYFLVINMLYNFLSCYFMARIASMEKPTITGVISSLFFLLVLAIASNSITWGV